MTTRQQLRNKFRSMNAIDKTGRIRADDTANSFLKISYEKSQVNNKPLTEIGTATSTITTNEKIQRVQSLRLDWVQATQVQEIDGYNNTFVVSWVDTIAISGSASYDVIYTPLYTLDDDTSEIIDDRFVDAIVFYALYLAYSSIGKLDLSQGAIALYNSSYRTDPATLIADFTKL